MAEENSLKFVSWEKLPSARAEADTDKTATNREWRPDSTGVVREYNSKVQVEQHVGNDLHKFEHLMIRRGAAMEAADLLPFQVHQAIQSKWMEALEEEPADASAYSHTTLAQVVKADKELFSMLAKMSERTTIKRRPDGSYPLEQYVDRALSSQRIEVILQHLPRASGTAAGTPAAARSSHQQSGGSNQSGEGASEQQLSRIWSAINNVNSRLSVGRGKGGFANRWVSSGNSPGKGGKQSGGQGKGRKATKGSKTKERGPPMPQELLGMMRAVPEGHDGAGEPICWAFNLEGCSDAPPGKRCRKGWHICMRPGCGKAHNQRNH